MNSGKKMKKNKMRRLIPVIILAAVLAAFFIYTGIYYHAGETAKEALGSDQNVAVAQEDYGWFFDGPSEENMLIFYPGAKVEETAYAPLLHALAENGMDVCLVKMPFRFAFFGVNRADKILDRYAYDQVFIGGHSLGGAMAASYAADHGEDLDGLVLFAAYPTKEIEEDLIEISIYGSEDEVVNLEKIEEGRNYAPKEYTEYVIEGGNHAQFGDYGIQSGDGLAEISAQEQQMQAVSLIFGALEEEKEKNDK